MSSSRILVVPRSCGASSFRFFQIHGLLLVARQVAATGLALVLDGNGVVRASYGYGATNRRMFSAEGNTTTYYGWDGGAIIAEYDAAGTNGLQWRTNYVYLEG